jgi:hypothetical protein
MALTTFGPMDYQGPIWGYNKRVTGKRLRQRFLDDMQCTSPCSLEKNATRIVIRKAEH